MKRQLKYISCLIFIFLAVFLSACSDKNTKPQPPEPSAILESKQAIGGSTNLFYIPNETVESGLMHTLFLYENDFLLCHSDENGYNLRLISSKTGEEIVSNTFEEFIIPNTQVCGEKIALTDWYDGDLLILDKNLEILASYQIYSESAARYLSPDAEKVYVFFPEYGIKILTLETGERKTLLVDTTNLYPANETTTNVTFSYTDLDSQMDICGAIDLETGELLEFPFDGSFFNMCVADDTWFATQAGTLNTHFLGNSNSIKTFELGNEYGHFSITSDTDQLLLTSYNDLGFEKMTLYDINGKFISECINSVEGTVVQGRPVWSEVDGGFFFIMIDPTGKDMLMFWDVNAESSGADIPLQDYQGEILPEGAVSKELYNRAKELSETYGIQIRIAEQIFDEYTGYTVDPCLDEEMISRALDAVEKALEVYPKGFFKQLAYGDIRKLELHLVTNLEMNDIPEDSGNGFTSFAGFASCESGYSLIVLDIFSIVELHLHHEIFHIVDNRLTFDANLRPDSNYAEENWMKLNPEDFQYADQLYNLPDSFYNGKYEEWFTSYYGRTNSQEDRATIMEAAAAGDHNMFIYAPYRQAKLEYLCECIRDAFDTTGWPDATAWENTLNQSRAAKK